MLLRCGSLASRSQANKFQFGRTVVSSVAQQGSPAKTGKAVPEQQDTSKHDLSVLVLKLFSDVIADERAAAYQQRKAKFESGGTDRKPAPPLAGISVFDGSVTHGTLASRYLKQVPRLRTITINEPVQTGTTVNAAHNTLVSAGGIPMDKAVCVNRDMRSILYEHAEYAKNFDVVDLSQEISNTYLYIDAAMQAVASDGGLMCFNSKDHSALLGQNMEACYARYGTVTLGSSVYRDEMALRTLLNAIETSAARYKRYIVPWLSIWKDNTARVYVRVFEDGEQVKHALSRRIMVYQSSLCPSFHVQPLGQPRYSDHSTAVVQHHTVAAAVSSAENSVAPDSSTNKGTMNAAAGAVTPKTTAPIVSTVATSNGSGAYRAAQWELPAVCEESGGAWKIAGPFWGGALHDPLILRKLMTRIRKSAREQADISNIQTNVNRLDGVAVQATPGAVMSSAGLVDNADSDGAKHTNATNKAGKTINSNTSKTGVSTEAPADVIASAPQLLQLLGDLSEELSVPFYYSLSALATTAQSSIPKHLEFSSALTNAGYKVSTFHGDVHVVKTDAPPSAVWDVMRGYCKTAAGKHTKQTKLSAVAQRILARPCQFTANFAHSREDRKKMILRRARNTAAK